MLLSVESFDLLALLLFVISLLCLCLANDLPSKQQIRCYKCVRRQNKLHLALLKWPNGALFSATRLGEKKKKKRKKMSQRAATWLNRSTRGSSGSQSGSLFYQKPFQKILQTLEIQRQKHTHTSVCFCLCIDFHRHTWAISRPLTPTLTLTLA